MKKKSVEFQRAGSAYNKKNLWLFALLVVSLIGVAFAMERKCGYQTKNKLVCDLANGFEHVDLGTCLEQTVGHLKFFLCDGHNEAGTRSDITTRTLTCYYQQNKNWAEAAQGLVDNCVLDLEYDAGWRTRTEL